jgi:CBS domain-containing protein
MLNGAIFTRRALVLDFHPDQLYAGAIRSKMGDLESSIAFGFFEEGKMSLLKIAHVPPANVEPGATVLEAVQVMAEEGVGAVAVVENGAIKGIFTERDLMLRVVLRDRATHDTKMIDVMTSPVETATEETPAQEALTHMLDRHLRHLPIVKADGQLLGMLSIRNLLEHMVEGLSREIESMDQFLLNDGPGG